MNATTQNTMSEKAIRDFLKRQSFTKDTEEYVSAREQARRWLAQFETDEQPYMLEVMKAMRIETKVKIDRAVAKLAKSIIKSLSNEHSKAAYFGIGDSPASSGNHFLYPLLSELRIDIKHARRIEEIPDLINSGVPLVFVDDIVGSGSQAVRYSKEIFSEITQNAIYCCLYGLESGVEKIQNEGNFAKVLVANRLTDKDRAFTENSQLFKESADREVILKIATKYGKRIYHDNPLGYENAGLLIAFPHNTPNNTLPIIWGGVESESFADYWEPLIARKKAPKTLSMSEVSVDFHPNLTPNFHLKLTPPKAV